MDATDPASKAAAALARAGARLLLRWPFHGHVLLALPRRPSMRTATFGVAFDGEGRHAIEVNPRWYLDLALERQQGVLLHAVLHLVLGHPFRALAAPVPQRFALACDLVVDPLIPEGFRPPGAVLPGDLGFPEGLTADAYDRLLAAAGEDRAPVDDVAGWAALRALGSDRAQALEPTLQAIVRTAAARVPTVGDLPGVLQEAIEAAALRPSRLGWRQILRRFGARTGRTRLKNTLRRPSKRYGTTPGLAIQRRHRLAVVVDTSASVDALALAAFFREVHHLWRLGTTLVVIEADTRVQATWDYRGHAPTQVHGRGGTRYDAALAHARALRPDGVVVFTDGLAPAPVRPPPLPLLWVVPAASGPTPRLPGRVAVMESP